MNKFKFYVSALLVAGILATGATSCVNDKESDSVQNIRNAKADELKASAAYLKAQAEAELIIANADKLYREAEAALKVQEAALMKAEIAFRQAEVDLKLAQIDIEKENAALAKSKAEAEIEAIKQEMKNQLDLFNHNKKLLELEYDLKVEQNKVLKAEERAKLYAKKAEAEGKLKELFRDFINLNWTIDNLTDIVRRTTLDIVGLKGTLITKQIDSVYFVNSFKITTEAKLKTEKQLLEISNKNLAFWKETLENADATVESLLDDIRSEEEKLVTEITKLDDLENLKEEKYSLMEEAFLKRDEAANLLYQFKYIFGEAIQKGYFVQYKSIEPLEVSYADFEKKDDGSYVIKDGKKVPGKCKTTSYLKTYDLVWDCSAKKEAYLFEIFRSQKLPEDARISFTEDNRCMIIQKVYIYLNNGEIGVSDYEYAIKTNKTNLNVAKLTLNVNLQQRDAQAIVHTKAAQVAADSYDKLKIAEYNLNEADRKGQDTKDLQKKYDDAFSEYYGYSKEGSYIVGKKELYEFAKNKLQAIQYMVDQKQELVSNYELISNDLSRYEIIVNNKEEDLVASKEKTETDATEAEEAYLEASGNVTVQTEIKNHLFEYIELLKNQPLNDKDGNPLSIKILSENLHQDIENEIYWINKNILLHSRDIENYTDILANLAEKTIVDGMAVEYITRTIREQISSKETYIIQKNAEIAQKTTEKNNLKKLIDAVQAEFDALNE